MRKIGKRVIKVFEHFIDILFGHDLFGKFIIITRSRTGSNLLISLLNSHQNIKAYGECFRILNDKNPKIIWKNIFTKKRKKIKYVGFKIFYYHPLDAGNKEVWNLLKRDSEIKIIHLQRENILRTHISRLIAGENNVWSITSHKNLIPISKKRVQLNIKELFQDIKKTQEWQKQIKSEFLNHSILEIKYEELILEEEEVMSKIFDFLDLPYFQVSSLLKKQNPEKIQDLVLNYSVLYDSLMNSEYSYMLEDENL